MKEIYILGGALGAGKTTLLSNLIKNDSLNQNDGIVVMDAAGEVDYNRIHSLAKNRNINVANASSACTVCDGPESVFKQLETMKGLDKVIIELSGQLPLSSMQSKMLQKGYDNFKSIYLVNPELFSLVQAGDEVPFANVVGFTKSNKDLNLESFGSTSKKIYVSRDERRRLDEIVEDSKINFPIDLEKNNSKHKHSLEEGFVTKFISKIINPYHDLLEINSLLRKISQNYDRVKGYVALNRDMILNFDGVYGEYKSATSFNPDLGNGLILVANNSEAYFNQEYLEKNLGMIIDKPDIPPVIRIGSNREKFQEYIQTAFSSKQYDDALGAAEQYDFENNDKSLYMNTLERFAQGKYNNLLNLDFSISQRVLQNMSLLYHLQKHRDIAKDIYESASYHYKKDFDNLSQKDWEEIKSKPNSESTIKYLKQIYNNL